jgi:hypothetical protein
MGHDKGREVNYLILNSKYQLHTKVYIYSCTVPYTDNIPFDYRHGYVKGTRKSEKITTINKSEC